MNCDVGSSLCKDIDKVSHIDFLPYYSMVNVKKKPTKFVKIQRRAFKGGIEEIKTHVVYSVPSEP